MENEVIKPEITEMEIFVLISADGYVEGWSSTPSGADHEVQITVEKDHNFFSTPFMYYKLVDGELTYSDSRELQDAKQVKDTELNAACQEAILAGFTHVINDKTYWFSYDFEAQGNFRDAKEMLSDEVVSEIPWTVREGGKDGPYTRIPVDLTIIRELSLVIMNHKMEKIAKYRDFLLPIVEDATTVEEVFSVKWGEG
jgi:hypothetical protein